MSAKAKSKTKKSSSGDNFLLLHGEKILFVLVIGLFVWMIKDGSGLQKFTLTADQINSSSSSADSKIQQSQVKPVEIDPAVVVYDYSNYSRLIKSALKVTAYETPVRWDQSLFPDRVKRPTIVPLPIENLKATACIGAIQYQEKAVISGVEAKVESGVGNNQGGGKIYGRHWVSITGSIPVRKQLADYMTKFSNAQFTDMIRDQPKYILYELERGIPSDDGNIKWEKIDIIKAMRKENNNWVGIGMEQVSGSYFTPIDPNYPPMAMSCPPMINRMFGEEVANLPNIPVQSSEMMEQATTDMEKRYKVLADMQNIKLEDVMKRSPFGNTMAGAAGPGGGAPRMDMPGGGMGGPDMAGGADMGQGQGQSRANPSWMVNKDIAVGSQGSFAPVDFYLFRYFDFDVKENITYYYRVRLYLANPNYDIDPNFVVDPATVNKTFIVSDFSDASNPVSLGQDSRIFVEQLQTPARKGQEPQIEVASIYFDYETASESIIKDQKIIRGQVANFLKQNHKAVESAAPSIMGGMDSPMAAPPKKKKKKTDKAGKVVDHISDICVLDVFGGYRLPTGDQRSPGKLLILEPNGLIQLRDVSEDVRELERYENKAKSPGAGGAPGFGLGPGSSMM